MTELLVVGAGVAGLTAAVAAADAGRTVTVLYKPATGGAPVTTTSYAQGGIAVVDTTDPSAEPDSIDRHLADTVAAGGPLVDRAAARSILADGPAAVARLVTWGARFDTDSAGRLRRTREGGHSVARIIHAGGDATGAEVQRALTAAARARPLITAKPARVQALLVAGDRIVGVRTDVGDEFGGAVVLATGGAGHLFASTTNPLGATGDGIALAAAAGAELRELDYVQFHPTMLYTPGARGRRPLISEAVRGEGARLIDAHGDSVTAGVHPMGDLAPRDVVARAVTDAMQRTGSPCVYLDARTVPDVAQRFPTVTQAVRAAGLDPASDLIPVTPGAHYLCGGVVTDLTGATSVPGLYAAGEVARTGLHGANRLASNSLLEALVMGQRVARAVTAPSWTTRSADRVIELDPSAADRAALQDAMTARCGVRRTVDGLSDLNALLADPAFRSVARPSFEDRALTTVASAMAAEALTRSKTPQEVVA
ncbi:L-aspartate oxidase OS=Tsukamurella paurometabola (strain ATCC 8368 / DSM / CCUG 35730 / CIP 100753 / JCM 10117 / KCTC 9821 / NBRC 16120 / NCIMB 702349/ NCTC 13040) OX=521096 GN=Tpau_2011 PE=3 SV=1 [Tsukamurella paurometabola]|uniref:L-aspartate oxidase n=1 Tax=Tsukamurella paurometabola (strain ATCC 8368 / DSM 20162 / CCUG 35730 / CIP 100753 / JCM 10117 / KCTC 9821 / NBRC 16120 / NCIMB 702349 / NCTC 13040) TaxID=521096 RepID=D5UNQ5_TSUPD|nr:L-aspartate oxidase [Tsukamurella paurometabola]ADG78623.1 L-aspartate oxidase [Tsukamurella paurometabola DSM 20162]SUP32463.1 L-aspartate oxidase [Tsukamurella paurometabola]